MTKLDALNNLIVNKLEGKKSNTILEAVNKAIKAYGGAGDAKTNAEAIKQLREYFSKGEAILAASLSNGENPFTFDFDNADYGERSVVRMVSVIFLSIYIKSIDFSKIDLQNSKIFPCFAGSQIETVNGLDKIKNQDGLEAGIGAFMCCPKLKSANITGLKNATYNPSLLSMMFAMCTSLESVDMSNVSFAQAETDITIFVGCTSLSDLKLKSADGEWYGNVPYMTITDFADCPLNKASIDQLISNLAQNNNGASFCISETAMNNLTPEVKTKAEARGWTITTTRPEM